LFDGIAALHAILLLTLLLGTACATHAGLALAFVAVGH